MAKNRKKYTEEFRRDAVRLMRNRGERTVADSKHDLPIAPNLLERRFDAERPNAARVSDITYLWTREGWTYLAVIIDIHSRKVVGWSLREPMTAELVCEALDSAVRLRRPGRGLVFHSDRGSQYASAAFRLMLWRNGMRQSMSRKGNCWDNAVSESFSATLKKELVRDVPFDSRAHARCDVFEYIEVFYNRRRAHSLLDYESPSSFEDCENKSNVA